MKASKSWIGVMNLIAFLACLLINYLSVALPLNGLSQKDLGIKYFNLFTPAGFTFSIWSLIYLLIIAYLIEGNKNSRSSWHWRWGFQLTCLFNALWLVVWHYEYLAISVVVMLGLLLTLIKIVQSRDIQGVWATRLFQVYLGWISVALMANLSSAGAYYFPNTSIEVEVFWVLILLFVAVGLTMIVIRSLGKVYFGVVVLWAFFGIYARSKTLENSEWIQIGSSLAMTVISSFILWALYQQRKKAIR